jgi:hypothetical protein
MGAYCAGLRNALERGSGPVPRARMNNLARTRNVKGSAALNVDLYELSW